MSEALLKIVVLYASFQYLAMCEKKEGDRQKKFDSEFMASVDN